MTYQKRSEGLEDNTSEGFVSSHQSQSENSGECSNGENTEDDGQVGNTVKDTDLPHVAQNDGGRLDATLAEVSSVEGGLNVSMSGDVLDNFVEAASAA